MNKNYENWKKEEKASFNGWDFSYIKNRIKDDNPDWNYKKEVEKAIKLSDSLLDIGTGGGEFLLSFKKLPLKTVATEGWEPNVAVAKRKLKIRKIKVFETDNDVKLPFGDEEFDLIINRHSPYNAKEIFRVLKVGGKFITQQVDGGNLYDLRKKFGVLKSIDWNLIKAKNDLKKSGFKVKIAKSWSGKTKFKDVGALVYYLKAIPWIVKGFSVDKYLPILMAMEKNRSRKKRINFVIKRFFITAIKQSAV